MRFTKNTRNILGGKKGQRNQRKLGEGRGFGERSKKRAYEAEESRHGIKGLKGMNWETNKCFH